MQNRKLFYLLSLFTHGDRHRFSLFLDSPYFNTSPTLRAFWDQWLLWIDPLLEGKDLTEQEFVAGSSIKLSRIDRLSSQLLRKAGEFLVTEGMQDKPQLQDVVLTTSIVDRDPSMGSSSRLLDQVRNRVGREPESPERHLALFYINAYVSAAKVRARKKVPNWQLEFAGLQALLRDFALTKEKQLGCGAVNAAKVFKQEKLTSNDEGQIAENALDKASSKAILPELYDKALSLLSGGENENVFPELLLVLKDKRTQISEGTRNDLYGYLLNHCIRQINLGNPPFLAHAFSLYEQLLESGDLLEDGLLSPQQFKNLVALACRLNKLDWTQKFIDKFKGKLTDDHQGLALHYNEAVLQFHKQEFARTIPAFRSISQASSHDVFYGLDARMYLWKSYFEYLDQLTALELDEMYRLYDAFRLYVDRNEKISRLHQVQYRNFVRLFRKFMQVLEKPAGPKRQAKLLAFQKQLARSQDLANKTWFASKVAEEIAKTLPGPQDQGTR